MSETYKPKNYNSVSPYLVVAGAQKMIELLQNIFGAEVTRQFDNPDGSVMHAEVRLDDSILMLSDATEQYPPNHHLIHVYVPDVDAAYTRALAAGCEPIKPPQTEEDDPDRRGMFADFAGNTWAVATQGADG